MADRRLQAKGPGTVVPSHAILTTHLQEAIQDLFGRRFTNFDEVITYIGNLPSADRVALVPRLRDILVRAENEAGDAAEILWDYALDDRALNTGRQSKLFVLDWAEMKGLVDRRKGVRRRVQEARRRLERLVGQPMLENCIIPLCGESTTIFDTLTKTLGKYEDRDSKQVLENACKHMMLRLEKKTRYNSGEPKPTPKDVVEGNAKKHKAPRATSERMAALKLRGYFVDDAGLIWIQGRPENFLEGWNAPPPGRVLPEVPTPTSSRKQPPPEKRPPPVTQPPPGANTPPPHAYLTGPPRRTTQSPEVGSIPDSQPSTPTRIQEAPGKVAKQNFPPPVTGPNPEMQRILAGATEAEKKKAEKKKEEIEATKRGASRSPSVARETQRSRRSPTEDDISITKVVSLLHSMKVVSLQTRGRASTRLRTEFITKHPIPVENPTRLEEALWQIVVRKVGAFRSGQKAVDFTKEDEQAIQQAEPRQFRDAAERIVDGIATSGFDEPNLAIYSQSMYDQGEIMLRLQMIQDTSMNTITRGIEALESRFGGRGARMIAGIGRYPGEPAIRLGIPEFETILRDRHHTGWLAGEVIQAAIRLYAGNRRVEIIDPNVWEAYRLTGLQRESLPVMGQNPEIVIIPYHFMEHWAVGIIHPSRGRMYFLDSMDDEHRRTVFMRDMGIFTADRLDIFGTGGYVLDGARSVQQLNDFDCGLYTIENARAYMNGNPPPEIIGNASRLETFSRLYDSVMTNAVHTDREAVRGTRPSPAPTGLSRAASRAVTPNPGQGSTVLGSPRDTELPTGLMSPLRNLTTDPGTGTAQNVAPSRPQPDNRPITHPQSVRRREQTLTPPGMAQGNLLGNLDTGRSRESTPDEL